jgi:hypothetical protein
MYRAGILIAALGLIAAGIPAVRAQDPTPQPDPPPFSLPFADPPGPTTWLYEQHYGNTTMAFNYGDEWYRDGQGLHFGLDLEAPCGTPVLAIADGIVTYVDGPGFGASPHNLVLDHPDTGLISLYGHLLEQPDLVRGQFVRRGEQIGLSGDPDITCESRPHLHLEIRRTGYMTALNPLLFIDVNWHMIASIGPFNNNFQQDLDTPYRWMRLEDQPEVNFSSGILNAYRHPWPPVLEVRAPVNPPPARTLDPLPEDVEVTRSVVSVAQWNLGAWWDPADLDAVYLVDAIPGESAAVFRQPLDGSARTYQGAIPPLLIAPDGSVTVARTANGLMAITRRADGTTWEIDTNGNYPAVSPDGTRLLWEVVNGEIVPGQSQPGLSVWVSNLDGSERRRVYSQAGGWTMWLDAHRLLIVRQPSPYGAETELSVLDIDAAAPEPYLLGSYRFLRGLKVAPGGGRIAFYLPFQDDPDTSGVYTQRTRPNTRPIRMDFFGAYQWRDDRSLYTLSFDMDQDTHALGLADAQTGDHRWLTDPDALPIRVANGEWSVSPDGSRIVYVDPTDYGLYLLAVEGK